MSTIRIIATIAFTVTTLICFLRESPAGVDTRGNAEERIASDFAEVQAGLGATSAGLSVLSKAAIAEGLLAGKPNLIEVGKILGKLLGYAEKLSSTLEKVAELDTDNGKRKLAREESSAVMKFLEGVVNPEFIIQDANRAVESLPVGVVDTDDSEFRISVGEAVRDPERALSKLLLLVDTMEQNIAELNKCEAFLVELERRANTASDALRALSDGLADIYGSGLAGVFSELFGFESLHADELAGWSAELASNAKAKLSQVRRARGAEQQRLRMLKSNVETIRKAIQ